MVKKIMGLVFSIFLLLNISGCIALLAGAAVGGIGTATWLSGKLSQEVNGSFDRALSAAKSALRSLKLNVTKETIKDNVAQIMSNNTDGRTVWIDIHRVSASTTRVEIRVGLAGDQEVARKIMNKIISYL